MRPETNSEEEGSDADDHNFQCDTVGENNLVTFMGIEQCVKLAFLHIIIQVALHTQ